MDRSEKIPTTETTEAIPIEVSPEKQLAAVERSARRPLELEGNRQSIAREVEPPAPSPSVGPRGLARELFILEQAREAMVQGRPASALAALAQYDREFASGSMSAEATALRIEALMQSGRADEGRSSARAFMATYPRSPLVDRVRVAAGL
jgi:hypothetical protein